MHMSFDRVSRAGGREGGDRTDKNTGAVGGTGLEERQGRSGWGGPGVDGRVIVGTTITPTITRTRTLNIARGVGQERDLTWVLGFL